ncbi:transposase InsO family protein [Microbacterium sp. AK009]|nr:hypothetical protein [Microbacterium sp. AK009]NYF15843.1 transposase InsO family protein [Microbacterium sp. AK009]
MITDNAIVYRRSHAFRAVLEAHDITQKFIRLHCPWTNGTESTTVEVSTG